MFVADRSEWQVFVQSSFSFASICSFRSNEGKGGRGTFKEAVKVDCSAKG
jgi:hypothetical protein